jgi:hypothetical protein
LFYWSLQIVLIDSLLLQFSWKESLACFSLYFSICALIEACKHMFVQHCIMQRNDGLLLSNRLGRWAWSGWLGRKPKSLGHSLRVNAVGQGMLRKTLLDRQISIQLRLVIFRFSYNQSSLFC